MTNQLNDSLAYGQRTTTLALNTPLFTDADGDTVVKTYTVVPAASFITYSNTSDVITVIAGTNDAGSYNITITGSDTHSDTSDATTSCIITVTNNSPPETTETFSNTTMLAYYDYLLDFDISLFSDLNGDTITYTLTHNASSWMNTNTTELSFYGTPTNSDLGIFIVTLNASDSFGGFSVYSYYVTVQKNYAPAVTTAFPTTINVQ